MRRITNEEAIEVLEDMKVKVEIPKAAVTQYKRNVALDMAIKSLELFGNSEQLPPAQPEYLHVIMEKIRKNYEKAMNVSYINDPMAVALSETWKEYVDEKEHKRG